MGKAHPELYDKYIPVQINPAVQAPAANCNYGMGGVCRLFAVGRGALVRRRDDGLGGDRYLNR